MFSVLHFEPESCALHIDGTAITQHTHGKALFSLIDRFYERGATDVQSSLQQLGTSGEKATQVEIYTSLLHEVRHYFDFVLTPFGFHRVRTAFETHHSLVGVLSHPEVTQIPIPLSAGTCPLSRRMIGLENYEDSLFEIFSRLPLSRSSNLKAMDRSEQIFEGLAFGIQSEIARVFFDDRECRERMPYLYELGDVSKPLNPRRRAFDEKYRWFGSLHYKLSPTPTASTARLVVWLLFASLCGSFGRTAKQHIGPLDHEHLKARVSGGRTLENEIPHIRLMKLLEYFNGHSYRDNDDWLVGYEDANAACKELFGWSMEEEIATDIEHDIRCYEELCELDAVRMEAVEQLGDPLLVFRELIEQRKRFFSAFTSNPAIAASPIDFVKVLRSDLLPPAVFSFPHGVDFKDYDKNKWDQVTDRVWRSPIPSEGSDSGAGAGADPVTYILRRKYRFEEEAVGRSWNVLCSAFVPAYRVLLFGNRCRTVCEVNVADPLLLQIEGVEFVWDLYYKTSDDVYPANDVFRFFGLTEARCDACSNVVGQDHCRYVSAATIRQNESFVSAYKKFHPALMVYALLVRDWTDWCLCEACLAAFAFRTPHHWNPDVERVVRLLDEDHRDAGIVASTNAECASKVGVLGYLSKHFVEALDHRDAGRDSEVIALLEPVAESSFFDANVDDHHIFRVHVYGTKMMLFVAHAMCADELGVDWGERIPVSTAEMLNAEADDGYGRAKNHFSQAIHYLESAIKTPPFSKIGENCFPSDVAESQNLNYMDDLAFALKWLDKMVLLFANEYGSEFFTHIELAVRKRGSEVSQYCYG